MKAKILYTNGDRIAELFWLNHTGTDIYYGQPRSSSKGSYHASGKLHTKENGNEKDGALVAPLKEVKGQFHLMTVGLSNTRIWPEGRYKKIEFTGKKLDNVLYIDSRAIPEKEFINISIGLLEPNNFAVLSSIINSIGTVKQVLIATESVPWVYSLLLWPLPDEIRPNKAI